MSAASKRTELLAVLRSWPHDAHAAVRSVALLQPPCPPLRVDGSIGERLSSPLRSSSSVITSTRLSVDFSAGWTEPRLYLALFVGRKRRTARAPARVSIATRAQASLTASTVACRPFLPEREGAWASQFWVVPRPAIALFSIRSDLEVQLRLWGLAQFKGRPPSRASLPTWKCTSGRSLDTILAAHAHSSSSSRSL
jgi:hypothetical protein